MTAWSSSLSLYFQETIWLLNSVFRFPSWDYEPKTWRLLFSTCKYFSPLTNLILNKSNQACSCKRKTDLLTFFSNFSDCSCKSFYFNHLFMSDSPSSLCSQHITNRLFYLSFAFPQLIVSQRKATDIPHHHSIILKKQQGFYFCCLLKFLPVIFPGRNHRITE